MTKHVKKGAYPLIKVRKFFVLLSELEFEISKMSRAEEPERQRELRNVVQHIRQVKGQILQWFCQNGGTARDCKQIYITARQLGARRRAPRRANGKKILRILLGHVSTILHVFLRAKSYLPEDE